MKTLFQAFQESTQQFDTKVALIDYPTGTQYTYDDLATQTEILIRHLSTHCPGNPGDRVGILMSNQLEFVLAFFALQALGYVVIPLNWRLSTQEHLHILNDAGAIGLISSLEFKDAYRALLGDLAWFIQAEPLDNTHAFPCPSFSFSTWLSQPIGSPDTLPSPSLQDLAVLIYTSGTTGKPKGVMLSHHNLLEDAKANAAVIQASSADVFVTTSPLFHVFGLTNVMLTALIQGASIVLVRRFNPKSILEAITRYRVTFLAAVPTMYQMMLSMLPNPAINLQSLRVCHSGAAPMAQAVFHQVEAAFGAPVQEGYGQSEASSIITSNPLYGPRKPGSIGLPLPGLTLEIVDEAGQPLPPGEIGELRVQGPTVMLGYWGNPTATSKTIRDGWLYTSDLGYQDQDGYIFLMGRQDDRINVGGTKVYPQEVEDTLYQHPSVASCAVTAEPSELYYQRVVAYVVLKPEVTSTESEIQTFCRASLAEYKVPKAFYFVNDIPKGPTGKILRNRLSPPRLSTPS